MTTSPGALNLRVYAGWEYHKADRYLGVVRTCGPNWGRPVQRCPHAAIGHDSPTSAMQCSYRVATNMGGTP